MRHRVLHRRLRPPQGIQSARDGVFIHNYTVVVTIPAVGIPYKRSKGCNLPLVMRSRQWFADLMCLLQVITKVLPPAVARATGRADQHLSFERVLEFPVLHSPCVAVNSRWVTSFADERSMLVERPTRQILRSL